MLHSIALGSILYMAVELAHNFLEREYVAERLQGEVYRLEGELDELRQEGRRVGEGGRVGGGAEGGGGAWWRFW